MRVLVIHQNFPGQFRAVAQAWAQRPGWEVVGIGREGAPGISGVRCLRYRLHRAPSRTQHPYLRSMESAVLHGQAVTRVLHRLNRAGFVPDAILAHPGWGETLYAKAVFPNARLVHFSEWYYRPMGADLGFDPEFPTGIDDQLRVQTWNALHLLNLQQCDAAVTPTRWQHQQHPVAYQDKITVIHEGVDGRLAPDASAQVTLPNGRVLKAGMPVVTYVARNLEPYRGFHRFVRALARVQSAHPECHAIIVGGDEVSYGAAPRSGKTWREVLTSEVALSSERTHFLGKVPYELYCRVLQISAVHVYLTYPFILSWSLLEAMASGCLIVASDTAPVREVVRDGVNGWLVDFFNEEALTMRILHALQVPDCQTRAMREQAQSDTAKSFTRAAALKHYDALIGASAG